MKSLRGLLMALSLILLTYTGTYSFETNAGSHLADPDDFPVPNNVPGLLFYIQRDPNANTICYQLNMDERGRLSEKDPVNAFWIRYTDGGIRRDLNYLQRKFAYGINVKETGS